MNYVVCWCMLMYVVVPLQIGKFQCASMCILAEPKEFCSKGRFLRVLRKGCKHGPQGSSEGSEGIPWSLVSLRLWKCCSKMMQNDAKSTCIRLVSRSLVVWCCLHHHTPCIVNCLYHSLYPLSTYEPLVPITCSNYITALLFLPG